MGMSYANLHAFCATCLMFFATTALLLLHMSAKTSASKNKLLSHISWIDIVALLPRSKLHKQFCRTPDQAN